nr:hypothetical protein [Diaphorobacter aerolatus]
MSLKFPVVSVIACALLTGWCALATAQTGRAAVPAPPPVASPQQNTMLPPAVEAALQRVKVPREALSAMVVELDSPPGPRSWPTAPTKRPIPHR